MQQRETRSTKEQHYLYISSFTKQLGYGAASAAAVTSVKHVGRNHWLFMLHNQQSASVIIALN